MKVWSISLLLLLLLLSTAAIAKKDVLVVDKDESLGSLSDKANTFATSIKREDEPGKTQDEMSWEAAQELLDAVKEFGNITHGPVAIYRDDLPLDYVAYWLVELNSSHYITISSGPKTGDYMVSSQGPLPSPITELDLTAEKYDKDCAKYLMMTPDGEMMCRDKTGKIVATTAEDLLLPGNMFDNDPNFEHAHRYIDMHITKLAALWAARASEVAKKAIWGDKQVTKSTESNVVTGFRENYVAPGGVIRVPVDGDTVSVKVKYTAEHKTETIEDVAQTQKAVCQMISTCNVNDDCSINLSQKKSVLHLNYMELEMSKDTPAVFNGRRSVDFQLRVEQVTGSVIVRHYSLDTTKHRQKRSKEYKDVSSWTEISIPDEHHFPSYWQHKIKKGCYVGCGPVAWAMVFGYYDRRSHSQPSIYGSGSQDLYRCGSDGTTGDKSCVAPQYSYTSDARVKSYFEQIAKTLGTWCIFSNGATPAFKMDNVEGFFKERQTSGSPTIQQTSNNWKIFARDSIAIKTREWIRNGWPVVVGTTESNVFEWHYPVATKYRYRTQKYRSCVTFIWKICGNWATETQYDMFTHQGQPRNMTMWRPMKLHYAAIASY